MVLSIGASLYPESDSKLRSSVHQWIYAAQSWFSSPFEKSRLNLSGLQVFCLLLIARQVSAVESDLVSLPGQEAPIDTLVPGTNCLWFYHKSSAQSVLIDILDSRGSLQAPS